MTATAMEAVPNRPRSRVAEARARRLIGFWSPRARRERADTFVRAQSQKPQESLQQQLQQQAPFAPYVTSCPKETFVTNYKFVIGMSVIEW
jgi:hypothetical protein